MEKELKRTVTMHGSKFVSLVNLLLYSMQHANDDDSWWDHGLIMDVLCDIIDDEAISHMLISTDSSNDQIEAAFDYLIAKQEKQNM